MKKQHNTRARNPGDMFIWRHPPIAFDLILDIGENHIKALVIKAGKCSIEYDFLPYSDTYWIYMPRKIPGNF